jgi:hypothetical protein
MKGSGFAPPWAALGVPAVAGTAFLAHELAAKAFARRAAALARELEGLLPDAHSTAPPPEIVRDFAHRAAPLSPVPAVVRLRQRGTMRLKPRDPWRPFTADQTISVRVPGFVWNAHAAIAPFLSARILDAYVGGRGLLEARLFGSLPLARSTGPETDRGELMRYLAELAWAPQAMLFNPMLRWREMDENVVEVSADSPDGPARVRLAFHAGDITGIEADDRPRTEGNRTVPRRWTGRFFDYRTMNGCRIPVRADVSWVLPDGVFQCWQGEITALETR